MAASAADGYRVDFIYLYGANCRRRRAVGGPVSAYYLLFAISVPNEARMVSRQSQNDIGGILAEEYLLKTQLVIVKT